MVRSRVDLPAPERPITPMKLPGATEKDALSTAAFAPKRHVKPSTTSIPIPELTRDQWLSPGFYKCVTALPRCGIRPHPPQRHADVTRLSSTPPMRCGQTSRRCRL